MMELFALLVGLISGFIAHQTDPVLKKIEGEGKQYWAHQSRSVIGVLSASLAMSLSIAGWHKRIKGNNYSFSQLVVEATRLYFAVFVFVGAGVQLGHFWDDFTAVRL